MFYSFDLVIPAGTAEASPAQLDVALVPGHIHRVAVQFPTGCRGLVHVRAFHALHQLWPSNPDGDFASNGLVIAWDESWDLDQEPFGFRLEGWSPGTAFIHTITWRFALAEAALPEGEFPEPPEPGPDLDTLELP